MAAFPMQIANLVSGSIDLGFHFRELMSGTYHRLDAQEEELPIAIELVARSGRLLRFARDRVHQIEGVIDAQGFADAAPFEGVLAIRFPHERRLIYDFHFTGNDGKKYKFRGERDIMIIALIDTITTLPASIYDEDGKELARCTLRWDLRGDLLRFLRSFRLTF